MSVGWKKGKGYTMPKDTRGIGPPVVDIATKGMQDTRQTASKDGQGQVTATTTKEHAPII